MNKKGLGFFSILFILTALTVGMIITTVPNFNVDDFKNNITVEDIDFNMEGQPELESAMEYYINGMVKAYVDLLKWVAEFTSKSPGLPYRLLIYVLLISLFAPVIILLVKLSVIVFLLTKEYFQSRKEKKELLRLKQNE